MRKVSLKNIVMDFVEINWEREQLKLSNLGKINLKRKAKRYSNHIKLLINTSEPLPRSFKTAVMPEHQPCVPNFKMVDQHDGNV